MDKTKKLIIGVSAIALLLVVGGIVLLKQQIADSTNVNIGKTGDVVAKVNGEEIKSTEVGTVQEMFSQQDQEISEKNALEQVINKKIILQEIQNKGYSVSTEEAETTIKEQLSAQGLSLDEYKQQVEQQGVSYEEQLQNISQDLAIQKYLTEAIGEEAVEVTDEETEQFYEMYKEQESGEEVPSYDELKPQIIASLEQQKQQEAINSLIQELRAEADIEYL